jgi:hypothetical protein
LGGEDAVFWITFEFAMMFGFQALSRELAPFEQFQGTERRGAACEYGVQTLENRTAASDARIISAGLLSQLSSPTTASAAFTGNVAVTAKDRAVAAGLKGHRRRLSAIRTNHRSSLGRS